MTPGCPVCAQLAEKNSTLEQALQAALDRLEAEFNRASLSRRAELRAAASEARLDFEISTIEVEQHKLVHMKRT